MKKFLIKVLIIVVIVLAAITFIQVRNGRKLSEVFMSDTEVAMNRYANENGGLTSFDFDAATIVDVDAMPERHSDESSDTDDDRSTDNMDVTMQYDSEGELSFPNNHCEEVTLFATDIQNVNAYVVNSTEIAKATLKENEKLYKDSIDWAKDISRILQSYIVSGYNGNIVINTDEIIAFNGFNLSKIAVYSVDSCLFRASELSYVINDRSIEISGLNGHTEIVLAEKKGFSLSNFVMMAGSDDVAGEFADGSISAKGQVIIEDNWFSSFAHFLGAPKMFYVSSGNPEADAEMLRNASDFVNRLHNPAVDSDCSFDLSVAAFKQLNAAEFAALKAKCTENTHGDINDYSPYFYRWYDYNDVLNKLGGSAIANNDDDKTATDRVAKSFCLDDTLAFLNTGSVFAQLGNCGGISRLTALVYNTGSAPTKGGFDLSVVAGPVDGPNAFPPVQLEWDISKDPENATLLDKGLWDWTTVRSATWDRIKNSRDGKKDGPQDDFLPYEEEFVKMMACYTAEYNTIPELNDEVRKVGEEYPSWDSIVNLIDFLEQDKIAMCNFTFRKADEKDKPLRSHVVNIYDFEILDSSVDASSMTKAELMDYIKNDAVRIAFKIYDSNLWPSDEVLHDSNSVGTSMGNNRLIVTRVANNGFLYNYKVYTDAGYICSNELAYEELCYRIKFCDENYNVF